MGAVRRTRQGTTAPDSNAPLGCFPEADPTASGDARGCSPSQGAIDDSNRHFVVADEVSTNSCRCRHDAGTGSRCRDRPSRSSASLCISCTALPVRCRRMMKDLPSELTRHPKSHLRLQLTGL